MKKLVVFAAILLTFGLVAFSYAATWDLQTDFSTTTNPQGAWSYGWWDGTAMQLYDTIIIGSMGPQWYDQDHRAGDYTPAIWKNTSSSGGYGVAPGEVSLHPGPSAEPSVVRWTSPGADIVTVSGHFGAGHSGAMSYYVLYNNSVLYSWINVPGDGEFSFAQAVSLGDILDFRVGGGYYSGNTPLSLTITGTTPVPVPAALWLLGPGLLGLLARKKLFK